MLFVSQDLRVDVALQVGAPSEQVLVVASAIALERDSTAVGAVVENTQVVNLPLDGRNFLELALLAPGAAPAAQGSASSVRGDFAFTANGAREDANSFLLDGVYNVDPKLNTPARAAAGRRAFASSRSSPAATMPAFGRNAAAQVNVVTEVGHQQPPRHRLRVLPQRRRSTRATTSRRATTPAPGLQPAASSAARSAARSCATGLFFFADYEGTRVTRGHHAGHQCADRRRASRRLLAEPARPAHQLLHGTAVSRQSDPVHVFRTRSAGRLRRSIRCRIGTRRSPTTSRRPTRRPQRSVRRARRPRGRGRLDAAHGALQLRRSHAARAVRRLRVLARARIRQRRPAPRRRIWWRPAHEPFDRGAAAQRGACRVQPGRQRRVSGRPGHQPQPAGRSAGAVVEPARLGPELHHGHRLSRRSGRSTTTRSRAITDVFQIRRHAHVDARRAPVQGRRRVALRRQEAFRDVQARGLLQFTQAFAHRQRAGGSPARPADRHRRRLARQPAAACAPHGSRPLRAGQRPVSTRR